MRPSTLGVALVLLLASGCTTPRYFQPVAGTAVPVQRVGFTVLPPQGADWFIAAGTPANVVAFGKRLRAQQPASVPATFGVAAESGRLGKVRNFDLRTEQGLRQGVEFLLSGSDPKRFRVLEQRYSFFQMQGTDCVRYSSSSEEGNNPRFPNVVFLLIANGVMCRHPTSPDYMVQVGHSERRVLGTESSVDDSARREAEAIVESLHFTPVER